MITQISTPALSLRSSDHADIYTSIITEIKWLHRYLHQHYHWGQVNAQISYAQHYHSVPNKPVPVRIVTGHGLEQQCSIPGGGRDFSPSLLQIPDRFYGPTALCALPSGIKRPKSKTHSSVTESNYPRTYKPSPRFTLVRFTAFFLLTPILIFTTCVFMPSHFRVNALWLVY